MQQSDVLYISDMAAKLGISREALRARVYRLTQLGQRQDMPEPFLLGNKWAWRRSTVDEWLAEKERLGINRPEEISDEK